MIIKHFTMMKQYWGIVAMTLLAACSGASTENTSGEGVSVVLPDEANEVTVEVLKKRLQELKAIAKIELEANDK